MGWFVARDSYSLLSKDAGEVKKYEKLEEERVTPSITPRHASVNRAAAQGDEEGGGISRLAPSPLVGGAHGGRRRHFLPSLGRLPRSQLPRRSQLHSNEKREAIRGSSGWNTECCQLEPTGTPACLPTLVARTDAAERLRPSRGTASSASWSTHVRCL